MTLVDWCSGCLTQACVDLQKNTVTGCNVIRRERDLKNKYMFETSQRCF